MKISYYHRCKIKTIRIALWDLILYGIENPKDLAKKLKTSRAAVLSVLNGE